jgi:CheY-like chemotaxis protein
MQAENPVVLVVEDHEDTRAALAELLRMHGYTVAAASNGREALELLAGGLEPCAIILDLMMPDMTGMAFRAEQVAKPDWADIPVIVHSAVETADADAALLGARFVPKPVDPQQILSLLRSYCPPGDSQTCPPAGGA